MDDLVKLVSEKINVPPEKAQTAVETVLNYLKAKLPDPIAGQIDNALSGQGAHLDELKKGLGGMFGS